jgi:hypothetical protein
MLQASGIRHQVSGFAGLVLVFVFFGFACGGEQVESAQGETGNTAAGRGGSSVAATEATRDSAAQARASSGATGEAGQFRQSCRMQTHVFKEDMSRAQARDFTARVTYRVQANLNGGDDKNLGDILDDLGVPAYKGLCG